MFDIDGVGERPGRAREVACALLLAADLVPKEAENLLVLRPASRVDPGHLLPDTQRLAPLMLVFVQLLQVDQRVAVLRVEHQDFLEGLERPIHEAAMPEVEPQA